MRRRFKPACHRRKNLRSCGRCGDTLSGALVLHPGAGILRPSRHRIL